MTNILIVGAGPCALVAAKTCRELGHDVSVLNPQVDKWSNVNPLDLTRKLILKSRNQKELFLAPNVVTRFSTRKVDVYENFVFGGLSELWGGVFLPPISRESLGQSFSEKEVSEAIQFIENIIEIDNKDSSIYSAYRNKLKINHHLSGQPPIARSRKNVNNKWSAADNFKEIKLDGIHFIDAILNKINVRKNGLLEVSYVNDLKQEITESFEHVFLGTGVFGTARIILNSRPDVDSIEIKDSKVSYRLGLSMPKLRYSNQVLEMKPELIKVYPDKVEGVERFVQIYRLSDELIKSIKYVKLQSIINLINKLSLGCLRLVMTFHPSTESKSIVVSKVNDGLQANQKNEEIRTKFGLRNYLRIMRHNHLLPITPEFKFNPGSGVHSGAYTFNYTNGISEKAIHGLVNWPSVYILGSASMKKIPTGPIMFEAMVNSRIIVKRAFA
jgi:hypothetical protein